MNVEISYNGEPITLRTVKNGFNACRRQQYCIKVACKSPARSKTLVTSVSLELLSERSRALHEECKACVVRKGLSPPARVSGGH